MVDEFGDECELFYCNVPEAKQDALVPIYQNAIERVSESYSQLKNYSGKTPKEVRKHFTGLVDEIDRTLGEARNQLQVLLLNETPNADK